MKKLDKMNSLCYLMCCRKVCHFFCHHLICLLQNCERKADYHDCSNMRRLCQNLSRSCRQVSVFHIHVELSVEVGLCFCRVKVNSAWVKRLAVAAKVWSRVYPMCRMGSLSWPNTCTYKIRVKGVVLSSSVQLLQLEQEVKALNLSRNL